MKKHKLQKPFLEQLAKMPIVATACEKLNISRQTVYRWQEEDPDFAKQVEDAMSQGDSLVNDMAENQLLIKIRNGEWPPTKYHLDKCHPKYREKNKARRKPPESREEQTKQKFIEDFKQLLQTKIPVKSQTLRMIEEDEKKSDPLLPT